MEREFIRRLITTIKCGVCGQPYEGGNVTILGQRDDLWFLSVSCSACGSQALVAAVIKEGESPQLLTDFTERERVKFRDLEAVGADDVLDLHIFLKSFDGDFVQLFAEE
ncbi:MAG: hypothetical protein KAX23_03015 [Dehalococcoidia bacterium]|jgi:hypothetical protein|nr:hypothetical protein [Chloroflexota bacterium]MCK4242502.1 hypothetical protein [Dehalococcoidia bacterium]